MRGLFALLVAVAVVGFAAAADNSNLAKRHGIDADLKTFPQAMPKEALASLVKAIEDKKADYIAAHLADPEFVDKRLKDTGTKFSDFVQEVTARLVKDPGSLKQMQRFIKDGTWDINEDKATVKLKEVPDRCLYLRRLGDRWFLENRYQPEEKK